MSTLPLRLAHRLVPSSLHKLFGIQESTIYGKARFMSAKEKEIFLSRKHAGLLFSEKRRLSLSDSCKNLALVAPTGSGKTTRFVIPNLLELQGSAVITDPSGEIFRLTSGYLTLKGFNVKTLQPSNIESSLRFNPLASFKTPQELRRLASILAQSSGGKDPFWTIGATNILYVALTALIQVEDSRYHNLANLRWLLNHFGTTGEGVSTFMSQYLDDITFAEYKAFVAQDTKVIASILSSARASLDLWSDPDIAELTRYDSMGIEELRNEKTVVYLIIPEHKISYFSLILNLFYTVCFEHCLSSWNDENETANSTLLPVYFFLDEAGNIGAIQNFPSIITTLRKRRCSISLILQELSQLEDLYGRQKAKSIFSGGCANKLFFSGLDLETCRYVEDALGQNTEYDTYFEGVSEYARTIGRPLLRADEVRMLSKNQGILISGNERPMQFHCPPFFQVPDWLERTQIPPASSATPQKAREPLCYLPLDQPVPPVESEIKTFEGAFENSCSNAHPMPQPFPIPSG